MAESGAAPLRPDIKSGSIADAVRSLVRDRPGHDWSAGLIAAELCKSEPTMRRMLRQEGTSFRQIGADERMRAARLVLLSGNSTVAHRYVTNVYALDVPAEGTQPNALNPPAVRRERPWYSWPRHGAPCS